MDWILISIAFSFVHLVGITHYDEEIWGAAAYCDTGMITLLATDGVPGLQACLSRLVLHEKSFIR